MTVLAASADRQAFIPMISGFLILMAALALGLRRLYRPEGADAAGSPPRAGRAVMARHVAGTVVGGYLLLMAVVVAYYYGVARVGPGFLQSAVTGTELLVGLAAPVFAVATWLAERRLDRGAGQRPEPDAGPARHPLARHPLAGYLLWAVLFGALFAWEGLALARVPDVPALSDVVRVIMRYPVGRWALFALWLWAGWRVFIQRWLFVH